MGFLRLWLAAVVVLGHCPVGLLGHPLHGALAVSAFYVISGFYIQLIISERYSGHSGWHWDFWASRLLRLFPAYWLALAATAAYIAATGHYPIHPVRFHADVFQDGDWIAKAYYILANLFIVGQDLSRWVTYDNGILVLTHARPDDWKRAFSSFMLVGQAWSIAVELSFYLIAPWLLMKRTPVVILVMVASIALRVALLAAGFDQQDWWNAFFPSEIATFCAGALACRFYRARLKFGTGHALGPLAAVTAILVFSYIYDRIASGWTYAGFVVFIACVTPFLFRSSRTSGVDRFAGDLSYPVYVIHFLVIGLLGDAGVGNFTIGIAAVLLSMAVSAAIVIWIERPISEFRHAQFVRGDATEVTEDRRTVAAT